MQRLVVRDRRLVAQGIVELTLADANGKLLPGAQAGAHIDVHLPQGLVRAYSLLTPSRGAPPTITALRWLCPIKAGAALAMSMRTAMWVANCKQVCPEIYSPCMTTLRRFCWSRAALASPRCSAWRGSASNKGAGGEWSMPRAAVRTRPTLTRCPAWVEHGPRILTMSTRGSRSMCKAICKDLILQHIFIAVDRKQ